MVSESTKEDKIENVEKPKDCLSCKLIGSTALLLGSAYVFTHGLRAKTPSKKIMSAVFGSSLGYTGFARFLDLYPFNMNPSMKQAVQTST